ncbi:ATP-binding protein [Streptomyces fradiae]|uniref:ATP-binding protein n=1 Tax=Streptomyces fradiae TaxID=1906 RepID=UPI0039857DCA
MLTKRAFAPIVLSPQDVERWPDSSVIQASTTAWRRSQALSIHLPATDRSVPICRDLARLWLDEQQLADQDTGHTALLVITELTTNAIVHTDSTVIAASLRRSRTHLRVQVRDQGRLSTGEHWHNTSGFGRGLGIVASCTQALGTHVADDGTRAIWATLPLKEAVRDTPRRSPEHHHAT